MWSRQRLARLSVAAAITAATAVCVISARAAPLDTLAVSILAYHRFGAVATGATTVRTSTFRWQLGYLKDHGHPIIPLRDLISYMRGNGPAPPPRSVVITADDGHASVFTEMLPVVRESRVPVTLFIYPSAISNASYAMTWRELDVLHRTGFFEIESHTYWHPNFRTEKQRLSSDAYRTFARMQLIKPRTVLGDTLRVEANLIAWPFGIYDDELVALARDAGYIAGFTIDRRVVTAREGIMALPRFLITDNDSGSRFTAMLPQAAR